MSEPAIKYRLIKKDKRTGARLGEIITPHGTFPTPMFMPVGTLATVKSIAPEELEEMGASIILSNTYHLWLRPGEDIVEEAGGLHKFMNWDKGILTDSGGFQVFSLSDMRRIEEEGVHFRNHLNGSKMFLSPEKAINIQNKLGPDIMMSFDECPPFDESYDYVKKSVARTSRWAERGLKAHANPDRQGLFGIIQGAGFKDLREQSARDLVAMDFPGYSIGGLSVGEPKAEMNRVLEFTTPLIPENKPRYLMGVGTPEDLVYGVQRGIDIFDCVLATRLARHAAALTHSGRLNLMNSKYSRDPEPIEEGCGCYTCQTFSRAYIRHLIMAKETLSGTLISIHNIHMLQELMKNIRQSILENRFSEFAKQFLSNYSYKPGITADQIILT